jgi:hypothetical protein
MHAQYQEQIIAKDIAPLRLAALFKPRVFLTAEPNLKVAVVQRLVVDDRVISHLRLAVHRQPADFIATDILRMRGGRIADDWHLEDNLTFLQQIGIVTSR